MTKTVSATRGRWVRGGALVLATCAVMADGPARAQDARPVTVAQAAEARRFDIPAQNLADALALFGQQAGMQISAHGDTVRGKTSTALAGTMAPEAALRTLLAGTGLISEVGDGGAVITAPAASSSAVTLDPIVVAGRGGVADYAGPSTVSLDTETLERLDPQDLQDVFKSTPGVQVGSSLPISQKVYVNGVEETNLSVTIDGSRQKNKLFHHNATTLIDPDLLKAVRVNPGVAPADAGPGALGGSIAYETKDVADLLAPGDNFGGMAGTEFNTNGNTLSNDLTLFGRNSGFEALGYFKLARGDEFEDGDGNRVLGSETDFVSGLGKLAYQHDTGYRFELSYENVEDDGDRPYRANFISTDAGRPTAATRNYRLERENLVVSFENATPTGLLNPYGRLALATTHLDALETGNDNFGTYESLNGMLANTSEIALGTVDVGVDFYSDTSEGSFPDYGAEWMGLEEKAQNYGLFAQARLEPTDRMRISFGGRGDLHRFEGLDGSDSENAGLSGNISGEYDLLPFLTASAGASHVFGGVDLAEPFIVNPDWAYPSGGMEPSTADNVFAGLEFRGEGISPRLAGFSLYGKVFKTTIDDIRDEEYRGGPNVYSDLESVGFEIGAGYEWADGFVKIGYADIDTEINGNSGTSEYQYIGTAIGQVVTAEAAYTVPATGVTIGADAQFFFEEDSTDIYTSSPGVPFPAYEVANAFVSYTPETHPFLTVRATVKNIFDETYADRASYGQEYPGVEVLNEPGRSFLLSAKVRF
ncbi:TonB-dependent receptor [Thalassobaculum sp. OXR-137]|uniref:TonB-dependent receptor n=1 Tax=Thalassobaculum sp. OXR-137 TaxID=3100173 RepID=UPI002AC9B242|nr:TonB-dependent receptor [Thalassobaculum sp. OXR-137]WPZ32365.1 TonB-dependent receptor [Thalassobaculum sp. OXR-137]